MDNETTIMKALIVTFIIGLVTVAYMYVGEYYKDIKVFNDIENASDTVDVPVLENVNLYEFKQPMIYYGSK